VDFGYLEVECVVVCRVDGGSGWLRSNGWHGTVFFTNLRRKDKKFWCRLEVYFNCNKFVVKSIINNQSYKMEILALVSNNPRGLNTSFVDDGGGVFPSEKIEDGFVAKVHLGDSVYEMEIGRDDLMECLEYLGFVESVNYGTSEVFCEVGVGSTPDGEEMFGYQNMVIGDWVDGFGRDKEIGAKVYSYQDMMLRRMVIVKRDRMIEKAA